MRMVTYSFPFSKSHQGLQVKGQHTGARLAGHSKEVCDCFELTDGRVLGITTENASTNYSVTRELQTTHEVSAIEWPALRNHISCMAHVIQLDSGAFMSSLGVNGHTKSCEAPERNEQFGENECTDIGKGQRLRKEGNGRINKVSAMRPGLAKIIETVRIARFFESPEIDLHIAENACCIDYADTWSWKRVCWLSKSQSLDGSTTPYGCENTLERDAGVAQACLPITWIHTGVASEPKA